MKAQEFTIDLQVFPLHIIKSALYGLSERIDGRIGTITDEKVAVTLLFAEEKADAAEVERVFNQALIAASVNERAFQAAAPIRNYLAQTALSITSQSQQTLADFAASMGQQPAAAQHAGSTSEHVNVVAPEFDAESSPTQAGNRIMIEEELGRVLLFVDSQRYHLPDVLWAAHLARRAISCGIDYLAGNRLMVRLRPSGQTDDLASLTSAFEYWLEIATEQPR